MAKVRLLNGKPLLVNGKVATTDACCCNKGGACCDGDFGCTQSSEADCIAAGNDYQGDGTLCNGATPPNICCPNFVTRIRMFGNINGTIDCNPCVVCGADPCGGTIDCNFDKTWRSPGDFHGWELCSFLQIVVGQSFDPVSLGCFTCTCPLDVDPAGNYDIGVVISPAPFVEASASVAVSCGPVSGCNGNGLLDQSSPWTGSPFGTYHFSGSDGVFNFDYTVVVS